MISIFSRSRQMLGLFLNGAMELCLPQELHYSINGLFGIVYISLLMGSNPNGQYSIQLFLMQFQDQKTRCL